MRLLHRNRSKRDGLLFQHSCRDARNSKDKKWMTFNVQMPTFIFISSKFLAAFFLLLVSQSRCQKMRKIQVSWVSWSGCAELGDELTQMGFRRSITGLLALRMMLEDPKMRQIYSSEKAPDASENKVTSPEGQITPVTTFSHFGFDTTDVD